MADTRNCQQCGAVFVPRREHARFCRVACRATWNREHVGDPAVDASALQWSITAMDETVQRLSVMATWDQVRAFREVGEAVWWVTMVDATLVRHHPAAYDDAMAGHTPAQRVLIEQALAGLRFVRNQLGNGAGLAGFVQATAPGSPAGMGTITDWAWRSVPPPSLVSQPARAQMWERSRYRAYGAHVVGQTIGEVFKQAAAFLAAAATIAFSETFPAGAPA